MLSLVPQMIDAVRLPVLAAGGIADGRQIAAALTVGAQGVVIGTRFIATPEAQAAQVAAQRRDELYRARRRRRRSQADLHADGSGRWIDPRDQACGRSLCRPAVRDRSGAAQGAGVDDGQSSASAFRGGDAISSGFARGRKSTSNLTFGVLGYAFRRRRRARQPRCSSYGSLDGSLLKYCAFLTNFGLKSTVSLGKVSLRDSPLAGRT